MKKPQINISTTERRGVAMPDWVHELIRVVAGVANYGIGDAFEEASMDWVKKIYHLNDDVRALLDQKAKSNPELRDLLAANVERIRKRH